MLFTEKIVIAAALKFLVTLREKNNPKLTFSVKIGPLVQIDLIYEYFVSMMPTCKYSIEDIYGN